MKEKDKHNIDDLFRSGLEDFELTPPVQNWDALDSALTKKLAARKRKNRLRFLIFSALLLLVGFTGYKLFSPENVETDKKNSAAETTVINDKPESAEPDKNQNHSQSQLSVGTLQEQTVQSKQPENVVNTPLPVLIPANKSTTVASKSNIIPQATISKNEIHNNAQKKIEPVPQTTNTAQKKTTVAANSIQPVNEKPVEVTRDERVKNIDIEEIKAVVGDKVSTVDVSAPAVEDAKSTSTASEESKEKETGDNTVFVTNQPPVEKNDGVLSNQNATQKNDAVAPPPVLNNTSNTTPVTTNQEGGIAVPPLAVSAEKKVAEPIVASSDSAHALNADNTPVQQSENSQSLVKRILSHLSAEIFYSPDLVNNKLVVNDEYTGTASTNINDYNNQKAAFSYSTGLNIRYDIGSRWNIGTGVYYSTFAQTAVYNSVSIVADSVYQEEHGHDDPNSGGGGHGGGGGPGGGHGGHGGGHHGNNPHDPPGNGDHHFVIHTPCGSIDLYNQPPNSPNNPQDGDTINIKTETSESISFINIPLTIRYNFGTTKFKYFVTAGGSVSFVSGDVVKLTINDSYSETNEHDGLKKMNYNLILGAGVQYNFYKKMNFFLSPTFRYSITPVNQYNPMKTYPYYIGIGAGFSLHF